MKKGKITILGIAITTVMCSACVTAENRGAVAEKDDIVINNDYVDSENDNIAAMSGKATLEETLILASMGTLSQVMKGATSTDPIEKYIVEDQEYLYSAYGDIGQLGEEGYYFSESFPTEEETETIAYQTKADVTHDGIEDLIRLSIYAEDTVRAEDFYSGYLGVAYVKVFRGMSDGGYESHPRFISRGYDASHVGNGTICVTHKDGQDYLLLSTIYEMQGEATYDYAVIYIDDERGIIMEDSADAAFAVWEEMHEDWGDKTHRSDVIPTFQKKIAPWIEDATILVSFDIDSDRDLSSMVEECPAEVFFDTVWEREW